MSFKVNWDFLGVATSVACAIHCAVLPVIITTLPIFGINIIHNSIFEWGMIVLALLVGCYSLLHGYLKHHKNYTPIGLFAGGAFFLIIKQFFDSYEYLFLSYAVLLIITAHFINYKYSYQQKSARVRNHKNQANSI